MFAMLLVVKQLLLRLAVRLQAADAHAQQSHGQAFGEERLAEQFVGCARQLLRYVGRTHQGTRATNGVKVGGADFEMHRTAAELVSA